MTAKTRSKKEIFETLSVPRAIAAMAIPTIISQLINLIYNLADSTIFMINTEGNTDPIKFRRIIWDGKDPVPTKFRIDK